MTAVLVVGVAGGAWAWDAHRDDVATAQTQRAQAADRAAAAVTAQDSDVDVAVGHDAALGQAQAAAVVAAARADLQQAADAARVTLAATDGQVGDDTVRQALAAQVAAADAMLAAVPTSSGTPPESGTASSGTALSGTALSGTASSGAGSTDPTPTAGAVGYSAADLRALGAALATGNAAVVAAHDAWTTQRAKAAASAAASSAATTAKPKSSAPSCETTYTGPPFYTSSPTVDGDGSNGKVPPSEMTAISWEKDEHGTPYYLRTAAAAALERLNVAFRAAFGHDLALDLTYRDYDTQVAMRAALGTVAAVPGTSKHGTGTALDVPERPCEYGWDTPQRNWLVTHGPSFGWTSPAWAHRDGSNPEYWHFEYVG